MTAVPYSEHTEAVGVGDHDTEEVCRRFARLLVAANDDSILDIAVADVARRGFRIDDMRRTVTPPPPSTWEAAERLSIELDELERHPLLPEAFREWVGEVLAVTDPDDPESLDNAALRLNRARADLDQENTES